MITKATPDKGKAESLIKMADITLERLKETDMIKYPSNTLIDYYDAIHKLMEALAVKEGVKTKGERRSSGTHRLHRQKTWFR